MAHIRMQEEIDQDWEFLREAYYAEGYSEEEFLKTMLALTQKGDLPTELKEIKHRIYSEISE